jgi:hypothetical protein
MGNRCRQCGKLYPLFAANYRPGTDGVAFENTGKCMSCRHGKRPGAQFSGGLMELKALLWEMNRRKKPRREGVRT